MPAFSLPFPLAARSVQTRAGVSVGPAGALASADVRRLAALFSLSGVAVVGARMLEFVVAGGTPLQEVAGVVWTSAPVPALIAACAAVVAAVVSSRAPAGRLTVAVLVGGAVAGVLSAVARVALPWWLLGWVDGAVVRFVQADLLVLSAVGAASVAALRLVAGSAGGRRAVLAVGCVAAVLVALVPVVDALALVGMGAQGGYFYLRQVMASPGELVPYLWREAEAGALAVGGVGLVAVIATVVRAGRRPAGRRAAGRRTGLAAAGPFVACAVVLLAATAGTVASAESALVRFGRMAWVDLRYASDDGDPGPSPFDLRTTRLARPDDGPRPNVVVLVLESFRADALGAYTPGLPTTPFLDSLARQGLRVETMTTTTPYTNKALVSIFGGIPPSGEPAPVESEPGAIPSPGLAGLLAPHGYRSAFFTPATLDYERKDVLMSNLGFQEAYGDGDYPADGFEVANPFGREDRIVLDRALEWAEGSARGGQPFLMGLLTLTAHYPYTVPQEAPRLHVDDSRHKYHEYLDAVHYTDAFVRDLVGGFERLGLLESTVFVIVGDHGDAFGEHTEISHGNVIWEEALRVPGLVYAPGLARVEPGRVVRGGHQVIDVVPTVADLLGAEWRGPSPPGVSLLQDAAPDRTLYHACHNSFACLALREGDVKTTFRHGYQPTRVYDLAADPGETRDLAPALPLDEVLRREAQLVDWSRAVRRAYAAPRAAPLTVGGSSADPLATDPPHLGRAVGAGRVGPPTTP